MLASWFTASRLKAVVQRPASVGRAARPIADRATAPSRPERRIRQTLEERRSGTADRRLASSTAFVRRGGTRLSASILPPRLLPVGLALVLTGIWFALNLRRFSPLDLLPFAWTWLTLWLALSVAVELWSRYSRAARPRRRPGDSARHR